MPAEAQRCFSGIFQYNGPAAVVTIAAVSQRSHAASLLGPPKSASSSPIVCGSMGLVFTLGIIVVEQNQ